MPVPVVWEYDVLLGQARWVSHQDLQECAEHQVDMSAGQPWDLLGSSVLQRPHGRWYASVVAGRDDAH